MGDTLDPVEAFEPMELVEEVLDRISGGLYPEFDPEG